VRIDSCYSISVLLLLFMKLIELSTERLFLKGYSPQDMLYIFSNYTKSEIMEMLGHVDEQDYFKEKDKVDRGYAAYNRGFILFLLIEKSTGKIIGRCGVHNWNQDCRRAEIGYHLNFEEYKRKGFMSEAISVIIDYAFTVMNLNRMEATVSPTNTASQAVMRKFKFRQEGLLREHYWIGDRFDDSMMFSLLRSEYFNR